MNQQPFDPNDPYTSWEQSTYQTGSTKPPKSKSGLIAVLLVIIIILVSLVTLLGILNIRMFHKLQGDPLGQTLPYYFHDDSPTEPELATGSTEAAPAQETEGPSVSITPTPQTQYNYPQDGGLSLQDIYVSAIDSVVSISCSSRGGSSTGTGVVLTADGYIVTNYHVVENASVIRILFTDGSVLDASLIGKDEISDLAVLRVDSNDLIPAQLGDSSSLRVGDSVVAIGDPLGIELRGTMTDGIISAINRDIEVDGRTMNLIQTNAALNSGNSGGPLLNCYGQVIGINTMKMGNSFNFSNVEGLGFAIPSNTVSQIVNQLIEQGYVSGRPELGITGEGISSFYQFYYNLPQGLQVTQVTPGSPAYQAGIQEGDILVSLDGVPIPNSETLKSVLYNYDPGDKVEVVIYRGGRQYVATLTMGESNG